MKNINIDELNELYECTKCGIKYTTSCVVDFPDYCGRCKDQYNKRLEEIRSHNKKELKAKDRFEKSMKKNMNFLIIGCGEQGTAIAWYLLQKPDVKFITIFDINKKSFEKSGKKLSKYLDKICFNEIPAGTNIYDFIDIFLGTNVYVNTIISAADYSINYYVAQLAIKHKVNMVDLGGNNGIVSRQFLLNQKAKNAGVSIIPDTGLAPGLAPWVAYYLLSKIPRDGTPSVKILVGGIPEKPINPPINYKSCFSVKGLVNEYRESCDIIENSQRKFIAPLERIEYFDDFEGFGELEAFTTSGGLSTLAETLSGTVSNLIYKSIRYKGHVECIKAMLQCGLFDDKYRENTEFALQEYLGKVKSDIVVLIKIEIGKVVYKSIIRGIHGHSAMAVSTGFTTAEVAYMQATGKINSYGVNYGEVVIPIGDLLKNLKQYGIIIYGEIPYD